MSAAFVISEKVDWVFVLQLHLRATDHFEIVNYQSELETCVARESFIVLVHHEFEAPLVQVDQEALQVFNWNAPLRIMLLKRLWREVPTNVEDTISEKEIG